MIFFVSWDKYNFFYGKGLVPQKVQYLSKAPFKPKGSKLNLFTNSEPSQYISPEIVLKVLANHSKDV